MPRLDDRWATRDYPVLEWIVAEFDTSDLDVHDTTVTEALDISPSEASAAIKNLEQGGYVTHVTWAFGDGFMVGDITERALRETGVWPNEEAMADQLLWFLEQKVENAPNPDARTRWIKIRDGFAGAGRDFTVEVAAAMATRTLGA